MFILTFSFFVFARFFSFWESITQSGIGLCLKYLIILGVFAFLFLTSYVLSYAKTTATYNENAIIVLGCGLESGGTPSYTLKNRLNGCIDYYKNNPDCYIVVTGGYSRGNKITEAEGMKNYLIENGIPENKIFCETKATNTKENFINSLQILQNFGINEDNVVFVTNSFHCYRAGVYAKQAGFENIKSLSVKTDQVVFIPAVLREVCGVAMMMFFKY